MRRCGKMVLHGVRVIDLTQFVSPAPVLGEHNRFILGEWLGYADEEIEELRRDRVITCGAGIS